MKRLLAGYIASSATLGLYRGWIADYTYNTYTYDIRPPSYCLATEKYMMKATRAFFNAVLYGSFGNISALYRLICRTEIYLTNKDPYQHTAAYHEFFGYTTLPPHK